MEPVRSSFRVGLKPGFGNCDRGEVLDTHGLPFACCKALISEPGAAIVSSDSFVD